MYHCSLTSFTQPSGGKAHCTPMWLLAKLKAEADRLYCTQPYSSLASFCEAYNLTLPKRGYWRLTGRQVGFIQGLPSSWGHLTATDGIMCYIEQHNKVFLGHFENWIQFTDPDAEVKLEAKPRKRQRDIATVILED